jgi:hypothetical protein
MKKYHPDLFANDKDMKTIKIMPAKPTTDPSAIDGE